MGEVIRRNAAIGDIINDVRTTLTNARARDEEWSAPAEGQLAAVLSLLDGLATEHQAAEAQATSLKARLKAADNQADDLLGRVHDDIWNLVGRPGAGYDPYLAVLFPSGASYYAQGDTDEQPARMHLLAELLVSAAHPKIPAAEGEKFAGEIRDGAATLEKVVEELRLPLARLQGLEKMRTAVVRAAQIQLAALKRLYKAKGMSEADIHQVIPDRAK